MEAVLRKADTPDHTATELSEQVETITREVKKLGRLAGMNAKRKLVEARDSGVDLYDRIRTNGREAVERRPLALLAVAAGVGALAGLLLSSRK